MAQELTKFQQELTDAVKVIESPDTQYALDYAKCRLYVLINRAVDIDLLPAGMCDIKVVLND